MHRRLITHLIKVYRVRAVVQFIRRGRVDGQTQPSSYILYLETRTTLVVMRESFKNCILYGAMCIIKRKQPSLCLEGVFCGGDFDWVGTTIRGDKLSVLDLDSEGKACTLCVSFGG